MLLYVIITKAIIFRWNLKHFWLMIMIKKDDYAKFLVYMKLRTQSEPQ